MKNALFVITVYHIIAAANGISCVVNEESGNYSIQDGCNFCGYSEIPSDSCAEPTGITWSCLKEPALYYYDDDRNMQVYSMLNSCSIRANNCWIYYLSICTSDYCNANCETTTESYTDQPTSASDIPTATDLPITWWWSTPFETSEPWQSTPNSDNRNIDFTAAVLGLLILHIFIY